MKNGYKAGLIVLIAAVIGIVGYILIQPSFVPESVGDLANNIGVDVGKVALSVSGNPEKKLIVFEENHISRAGQIEIAIMLNRLHENGSKVIALEGFEVGNKLDLSWFHRLPNEEVKEEVAVQLLKKGEISNAELLALVYPDVEVWGTEKKKEYDIHLSDDAEFSRILYLIAIADELMSPDQVSKANQLWEHEKYEEFLDFVINSSQWIQEVDERWSNAVSIEEELSILDEIQRKADDVGAEIDRETRDDFRDLKTFYETASKRSETITANALDSCERCPDVPIALIIGAGHTSKVSKLLNKSHAAYAVITPTSFSTLDDTSTLNLSAYNRKFEYLSVDEEGMLGSFLDNREVYKKPPSVVDELHFKSQSELLYATIIIAAAPFPLPSGIKKELSSFQYVKVDMGSINKEVDDEITFKATALDANGHYKTLYTRIHLSKGERKKTLEEPLEERLFEAREDVKNKEKQEEMRKEKLVEVSPKVFAKYDFKPITKSIVKD